MIKDTQNCQDTKNKTPESIEKYKEEIGKLNGEISEAKEKAKNILAKVDDAEKIEAEKALPKTSPAKEGSNKFAAAGVLLALVLLNKRRKKEK